MSSPRCQTASSRGSARGPARRPREPSSTATRPRGWRRARRASAPLGRTLARRSRDDPALRSWAGESSAALLRGGLSGNKARVTRVAAGHQGSQTWVDGWCRRGVGVRGGGGAEGRPRVLVGSGLRSAHCCRVNAVGCGSCTAKEAKVKAILSGFAGRRPLNAIAPPHPLKGTTHEEDYSRKFCKHPEGKLNSETTIVDEGTGDFGPFWYPRDSLVGGKRRESFECLHFSQRKD